MGRTIRNTASRPSSGRDGDNCAMRFAPCLPEPERLVGLGFRYWLLGNATEDLRHRERACSLYTGVFGLVGAKASISALSHWVDALAGAARREIEIFPESCSGFCRDECIAISMIAASQHQTCPAMRACAVALVETASIDAVLSHAQAFGDTLASLDYVLSRNSIIAATAAMPAANRLPA